MRPRQSVAWPLSQDEVMDSPKTTSRISPPAMLARYGRILIDGQRHDSRGRNLHFRVCVEREA